MKHQFISEENIENLDERKIMKRDHLMKWKKIITEASEQDDNNYNEQEDEDDTDTFVMWKLKRQSYRC